MSKRTQSIRRGSPLATIALILTVWVGVRAISWENPFALADFPLPSAADLIADNSSSGATGANEVRSLDLAAADTEQHSGVVAPLTVLSTASLFAPEPGAWISPDQRRSASVGHQMLWMRAGSWQRARQMPGGARSYGIASSMQRAGVSPLAPMIERIGEHSEADRWTVDIWGFWRQGSSASATSQGRVPIYGASQFGARLTYRAAPASSHDPHLFLRGYRAVVPRGESELAIGASARPIGAVPVRIAAELRGTYSENRTDLRPAILATTELAPQDLFAGFRLEAYGAAGYVGGNADTHFADGQIAVTREVAGFQGPLETETTLSLGAGAWGGAQKDANRIDVGPTVRVDLRIGEVPARISVDWREKVSGDAAPNSGIAATLSTRF